MVFINYLFQNQIEALEELVPDFKIASAVLHLDEASPHMHIVGVPVATGYKRGLAKQTAKTKEFTMKTLSMLQEEMHKKAEEEMEQNPELFAGEEIKTIERGRNSDWSKEYFVNTTHTIDYELESYKGKTITLKRIGKMPMPLDIYIKKKFLK